MDSSRKNALLFLKLGVAFAFLYPAFSAFSDPALWVGYVPAWIETFIPRETFLVLFSLFEILVALGVLFLNKTFPSLVAGIILISIVIFNPSEFPIIFRDVSIAGMAFALTFLLKTR